jgi:hypothetical protein
MKTKIGAILVLELVFAASFANAGVSVGFHGGWHGGGWHHHHGWYGPNVGFYLGPSDPYWYPPYYSYYPNYPYYPTYYDPYYSPYYPPQAVPYYPPGNPPVYPAAPSTPSNPSVPDKSRHDLKYLNSQFGLARNAVDFQYQDGDISKEEETAALQHIDSLEQEAKSQAASGGGTISGDQERDLLHALRTGTPLPLPSSNTTSQNETAEPQTQTPRQEETPRHDIKGVSDQIARLHKQLDKKLASGDITKSQHTAETEYLNQLDKIAQAQARANGGKLTDNQENQLREELLHMDSTLQRNFIVH